MKRYKVLLSLFCVVVFVFLAVGTSGDDEEPAAEPEEIEEGVEEPVLGEAEEETLPDKKALEQMVLNLMQENFGGTAEIELIEGEKVFNVTSTDPAFVTEIIAIMDGDLDIEVWNGLVESMKEMSASIETMLPGYVVSLVNPVNTENTLLMVMDGVVIYDFIND